MLESFLSQKTRSLKICGVCNQEDAWGLVERGVEAMGVNFFKGSKRFIPIEQSEGFLSQVAGRILRVGVFVDAPREEVESLFLRKSIDVAQFHGRESREYCAFFKEKKRPFIKAFGVDSIDESLLNLYPDAVLLDSPGGGTGKTFDWQIARDFSARYPHLPLLLAGGIRPDNVNQALTSHTTCCALDVASGAERAPGIKDWSKVESLCQALAKHAF